jgi:hypothetical protein
MPVTISLSLNRSFRGRPMLRDSITMLPSVIVTNTGAKCNHFFESAISSQLSASSFLRKKKILSIADG